MSNKGYTWFALNNSTTDYVELSRKLAKSIKQYNKENQVCIITDKPVEYKEFDHVVVLKQDYSKKQEWKLNNEWQVFNLTPFKHTIKLEADMLFTSNTDWWWNYLHQHNMIFSYHVRCYRDKVIKHTPYRKLFVTNKLPDVYNGLTYFRKSKQAKAFYNTCQDIILNWNKVRDTMLINCHDTYPSTDVVYALAYRIIDPTQKQLINYPWFKFIHNKPAIQGQDVADLNSYLMPMKIGNKILVGSQRLSRVWHYVDKTMPEELNARVF